MPSGTIPRRAPKVRHTKIPETDAIFVQVTQMNHSADQAADVLRLSMDAQAIGTVGPCARGGKSRGQEAAADHDFQPEATVTPVGIWLPTSHAWFGYGITSTVTRDGLVERLVQWGETVRERLAHLTTLVMNRDNGPENHSRRTQFMQRLVELAHRYHRRVRWAYYPRPIVSTIRSSAAGASSNTTGTGHSSTPLRQSWR